MVKTICPSCKTHPIATGRYLCPQCEEKMTGRPQSASSSQEASAGSAYRCERCSTALESDDLFCPSCGCPRSASEQPSSAHASPNANAPHAPKYEVYHCTKCGAVLIPGDMSCSKCGLKFDQPVPKTRVHDAPHVGPAPSVPSRSPRKSLRGLAVLTLALFALGWGALLLSSKNQEWKRHSQDYAAAHEQYLQKETALQQQAHQPTPQELQGGANDQAAALVSQQEQSAQAVARAQAAAQQREQAQADASTAQMQRANDAAMADTARSNASSDRDDAEKQLANAMEPQQRSFPYTADGDKDRLEWQRQVMENRAQEVGKQQQRIDHDNDLLSGHASSP